MLSENLPQERLSVAVNSQAAAVKALDDTIDYTKGRKAFGAPVASFQNTKFELAACATEIEAGQALVDRALIDHEHGELTAADAAKVKLFCTELQGRVIDRLSAAARWLWIHDGVSDRAGLCRCSSVADLRGDERNDEGDHRQVTGTVTVPGNQADVRLRIEYFARWAHLNAIAHGGLRVAVGLRGFGGKVPVRRILRCPKLAKGLLIWSTLWNSSWNASVRGVA